MDSGLLKQLGKNAVAVAFAVSTAIGVVLGVIGPFDTYAKAALAVRVAYWVLSLWGGWAIFGLTVPVLARRAYARKVAPWLWAPPAIMVLAIPAAIFSRILAWEFWASTGQVGWLEWYAQSLAVSTIATLGLLWWTYPRLGAPPSDINASGINPDSADPRDRLPPRLGRTVLCLQMEDHYVRVHTPLGSALVLMSLSQAIAGLKDVEGAQTHRSWWVARSAVAGVVEDGRNLRLKLSGGQEAPVSRARVSSLRAEGWLDA